MAEDEKFLFDFKKVNDDIISLCIFYSSII